MAGSDGKKPPRRPAPTVYEPRAGSRAPNAPGPSGSQEAGSDFWKSVGAKAAAGQPPGSGSAGAGRGGGNYQGRIPIGTQLNHIYEIRRFIARGGMGEVYEGVNISTDERVAIKFMLTHLAEDPQVQEMFRREPQKLARLNHPALVQYRLATTEPQLGVFYIVTEFVDGVGLDEQIGKLRPTPEELKRLMIWLAQGLGAAHHAGVFHRDVSPDNILLPLGRLDRAKIIDFGIAKGSKAGQATIIGQGFAGKLNFVAPEQIGDFGRSIGPWTDIYSLGLVMLALATGQALDMGGTAVEAVDRRRAGVDLSGAPPSLRGVFARMLAPDPKDRFQTTDDLIAALSGVHEDGASSGVAPAPPRGPASPPAAPPRPPKAPKPAVNPRPPRASTGASGVSKARPPANRTRTFAIAGAAVAGVLALGVGWLVISGGHKAAGSSATATANGPEAILDPVLKSVKCGWPAVTAPAEGSAAYDIVGRAQDFPAENGKLADAVRNRQVGGRDLQVNPQLEGGPQSAQCAALEAFNQARAPMASETWLTAANPTVIQMASSDCQNDPAKGAAVVKGALPVRKDIDGADVAMFLLEPNGQLHSVFSSRAQLAAMAKTSPSLASLDDSGAFKLTICLAQRGLNGVALLSGKPSFDFGLPAVGESRETPARFFATFNETSQAKRRQVQMAWFQLNAGEAGPAQPQPSVQPAPRPAESAKPPPTPAPRPHPRPRPPHPHQVKAPPPKPAAAKPGPSVFIMRPVA